MTLTPAALESVRTLCVGLALSGLIASAFELFAERRASFSLLERGGIGAVAALPMLAFGAPFIILRNTPPARRRPSPFPGPSLFRPRRGRPRPARPGPRA